jgi:hypothetical protein
MPNPPAPVPSGLLPPELARACADVDLAGPGDTVAGRPASA